MYIWVKNFVWPKERSDLCPWLGGGGIPERIVFRVRSGHVRCEDGGVHNGLVLECRMVMSERPTM